MAIRRCRSRRIYLRVTLVMHIPPGINGRNNASFWRPNYYTTFLKTVSMYASKLQMSILAGHHHMDSMRLMYPAVGVPLAAFLVPSLSPNSNSNPSFRRWFYDTSTHGLINYHQYFADLAMTAALSRPQWLLEYDFNLAYGVRLTWCLFLLLDDVSVVQIRGRFVWAHAIGPVDDGYVSDEIYSLLRQRSSLLDVQRSVYNFRWFHGMCERKFNEVDI